MITTHQFYQFDYYRAEVITARPLTDGDIDDLVEWLESLRPETTVGYPELPPGYHYDDDGDICRTDDEALVWLGMELRDGSVKVIYLNQSREEFVAELWEAHHRERTETHTLHRASGVVERRRVRGDEQLELPEPTRGHAWESDKATNTHTEFRLGDALRRVWEEHRG